jgi:hypothetical protein
MSAAMTHWRVLAAGWRLNVMPIYDWRLEIAVALSFDRDSPIRNRQSVNLQSAVINRQ